jgi:hypothetical protein
MFAIVKPSPGVSVWQSRFWAQCSTPRQHQGQLRAPPLSQFQNQFRGQNRIVPAGLQANKLFGFNRLLLSMMSVLVVSAGFASHQRHNSERRDYFSLAYSAFAARRMGMSGSASFHRARKSCRHLIQYRTEREQVRSCLQFFASCLLRRHVSHRAHRGTEAGQEFPRGGGRLFDTLALGPAGTNFAKPKSRILV